MPACKTLGQPEEQAGLVTILPRSPISSWICCQVSFTDRNPILGVFWPLSFDIPRTSLPEGSDTQQNFRAFRRTEGFSCPPCQHTALCAAVTSSSTSPFLLGCGVYLHGCPVFDVVLLSQLLTGEVHVLLPQPLALPTCLLRRR